MPRRKRLIPLRDKEQTKRIMVDSVGEVLREEGYKGLFINRLDRLGTELGFTKKLIYKYFGGLDGLVEAFAMEQDYWMMYSAAMKDSISSVAAKESELLVSETLQRQLAFFFREVEMQELIRWELSGESELMKSIHLTRELMGERFMELTEPVFKDSGVSLEAVSALLVAGIYYIVLHAKHNGPMFCNLDVVSEAGQTELMKTIGQIVGWAYKEARESQTK